MGHLKEGGAIQKPIEPMSPDHLAIANGRERILFPVQCLTAQTIHLGVPVREVRIAAAAPPPLRALGRGGGLDMSSPCLPTPLWPI